ncbi:hypothetical protein [uncultured Nocardioides sp.]|uniref:hypothetical protein n=1 Tax=uncultured Nocardioides sp. TaxID=198441 RepID=UPI002619DFD8|nr:hypothetical protein [uncultured Nocardioides sp.]
MTGSVVRGPRAWVARVPRRLAVGVLVVVLVAVGAGAWWVQRPYASDLGDTAGRSAGTVSPGLAARALAQLRTALVDGDRGTARALAPSDDPAAADLLEAVVDNVEALRVDDLGLRYVDEVPAAEGTPAGRWPAAVELTWRFEGLDPGRSSVETVVGFARDADRVAVTGFGPAAGAATGEAPFGGSGASTSAGTRTPVWLSGPVEVRRGPGVLVLAASEVAGELDRYAALADAAVPAVAADVPDWDRRLVVEVPRDGAALAAAVGSDEGSVAAAAAITAAVDGSPGAEAGGVHVFVNPAVLDPLGARGAQLVMSHEAVHVATRAPGSPAPTWLVEGYADYVALQGAGIDEQRAAAQVAERVREDGAPATLPTPADFDLNGTHAGATYEAAWLACVLLAERAGPDGLRRVYERADAGEPLPSALAGATDLDVAALTRLWQERLRAVARRAS